MFRNMGLSGMPRTPKLVPEGVNGHRFGQLLHLSRGNHHQVISSQRIVDHRLLQLHIQRVDFGLPSSFNAKTWPLVCKRLLRWRTGNVVSGS